MTVKAISPEPNKDLVSDITELLEQAKRGEVQAAAIATVNTKGQFMTLWERGSVPVLTLFAASEALKLDIWESGFDHD